VPGNAVELLLESFRRPAQGARPMRAAARRLDELSSEVGELPIASHQIQPGAWAAGRPLLDLDLRARTGALIIAVRQGAQNVPSPSPELRLDFGDVLYLMGGPEDIARARRRIATGN
jgi:CPA2 family monovalent cation:H+ antiporter-2